jgi:hypothetical protein
VKELVYRREFVERATQRQIQMCETIHSRKQESYLYKYVKPLRGGEMDDNT